MHAYLSSFSKTSNVCLDSSSSVASLCGSAEMPVRCLRVRVTLLLSPSWPPMCLLPPTCNTLLNLSRCERSISISSFRARRAASSSRMRSSRARSNDSMSPVSPMAPIGPAAAAAALTHSAPWLSRRVAVVVVAASSSALFSHDEKHSESKHKRIHPAVVARFGKAGTTHTRTTHSPHADLTRAWKSAKSRRTARTHAAAAAREKVTSACWVRYLVSAGCARRDNNGNGCARLCETRTHRETWVSDSTQIVVSRYFI